MISFFKNSLRVFQDSRPIVILLSSCLMINFLTFAQKGGAELPESATALQSDLFAVLDSLMQQYGFPGATAAIVLPDGTIQAAAVGYADVESKVLMTNQSRMLAASIGKTFVGAAVTALSIEGKICPDTKVAQYFDDGDWVKRLPNGEQMTVRQLLNHSSGLPDHVYQHSFAQALSEKWRATDNPMTPMDLIQFVLDLPPLFEAGKAWSYSDTGYLLLGLIIEKVSGKTVFDVITEKFIQPLKLSSTEASNHKKLQGLAAGYVSGDNPFGFPSKTINTDGEMYWHPGIEWAGGGFVSNATDLAYWAWALYSGKAMPQPYLSQLLDGIPVDRESADVFYGAGVLIFHNSPLGTTYGHNGWIPGYCSGMRFYADYGFSLAFQINTDIGIIDREDNPMRKIETALAKIVIRHLQAQ